MKTSKYARNKIKTLKMRICLGIKMCDNNDYRIELIYIKV